MRAVDLFAGCGGLSKGFQNSGFEIIGAYDAWSPAITCYTKNFSHPCLQFDLNNHSNACKDIFERKPKIIIGGPPCQDFSHAGKRQESHQANLTIVFSKIIQKVRPAWLVMENVERTQKSHAYSQIVKLVKREKLSKRAAMD